VFLQESDHLINSILKILPFIDIKMPARSGTSLLMLFRQAHLLLAYTNLAIRDYGMRRKTHWLERWDIRGRRLSARGFVPG
jgi:hypothetical protein